MHCGNGEGMVGVIGISAAGDGAGCWIKKYGAGRWWGLLNLVPLLPVHSILVVGLQYSQSAGIVARTHQTVSNLFVLQARISQAVARIADRTASQHLRGHVTSSVI